MTIIDPTTHPAPSRPGLRDDQQLLRMSKLALVLGCGLADALDVYAWLHGWHEYGPDSHQEPELVTSRLAQLDDVTRLAAHGNAILWKDRILAVLHTADTPTAPLS